MNINLGTFPKPMAREISKYFSRIKRIRNSNNKYQDFDIKFKSRTYGAGGRHRNMPIGLSTKVAVYLCLKERSRLIFLRTECFDTYEEARQYGITVAESRDLFKIIKKGSQWRVRVYSGYLRS